MDTDLIDRIYEASVVPELWPDVLDELSELTDARGGLLFAVQDRVLNWTASDSVHDAFESYVVDGWFRRCGRRICMFKHAHSAFLREHDYWSEEELENNEIYRDFFRPRDLGYSAGTGLAIPTGDNIVFSIEQSYSNGPLESAQVALLNELRPHLARSAMVAARLGLKSAKGASETLAKLGVPTILLKADGTAIDISNFTDDMTHHIVWGGNNSVGLKDPVANDLLQAAICSLTAGNQASVQSFPVRDDGDQAHLVAHLIPINRSAHDLFANAYALLVLNPVSAKSVPPVELVRSLFDLTASEARVARQLAAGRSVDEIAEHGGVSLSTVRTHVRKVLEKTGCTRQAEVVALMANIALEREPLEN